MNCQECGKEHAEPRACEGCGKCLYKNVEKQIPDDHWCLVVCTCGKVQLWD